MGEDADHARRDASVPDTPIAVRAKKRRRDKSRFGCCSMRGSLSKRGTSYGLQRKGSNPLFRAASCRPQVFPSPTGVILRFGASSRTRRTPFVGSSRANACPPVAGICPPPWRDLLSTIRTTMDLRPIHPILFFDLIVDTEEDRAHLEPCLQALEQDPASNVAIQRSGDCIALAAEDELQLETVLQQIVRAVPVLFGELRIGYRETIRLAAEAEGKYIRQTGGPGNYGHCYVRIDPNGRGRGYRFVNEIESGTIPDEYIKPIDDGIRAAMAFGILAGYPMTDVSATLFG